MSNYKIEYKTVTVDHVEKIDQRVADFLDDGWAPHGGPALAVVDKEITVMQAMVRTVAAEPEEPEEREARASDFDPHTYFK